MIKRTTSSPADLAAANINLVNGDPYSGSCELAQNLLFRPLAGQPPHETPISNLYHIGASTWPGPGLGGGSGSMVAKELVRKHSLQFEWTALSRRLHEKWPGR